MEKSRNTSGPPWKSTSLKMHDWNSNERFFISHVLSL
jgi:hypothetical protein